MEEQYSGKLVIITGLSGAGKTAALRYFEDAGYYCVDNLPASLLLSLIGFFTVKDKDINKIAVAIDLRSGDLFNEIYNTLENLKKQKINYKVLFLEAAKSIIMKRFSLTRRKHPLVVDGDILSGIEKETEKLYYLREMSDVIINTTSLSPRELKIEIAERMMSEEEKATCFKFHWCLLDINLGFPRKALILLWMSGFYQTPIISMISKALMASMKKLLILS